ncbi:MAG: aminoglycoside phosphotransferase, partial [Candidatus Dadabacteria bacterium]|nr:aminoglycoside phosphotransferase [Candidatus Dadabacteria bacterium]
NIAMFEHQPVIFDCIEFSEELRWIDIINEIAFLVMDLDAREQSAFAWRFLNLYLQISGDYVGLKLLRFYQVYRALVRCKVACIRYSQTHPVHAAGL